jgi:hypothetical protein
LNPAIKQGKVLRNVATLVDPPKKARRDLQPLSADQARELVAGTEADLLGPLYALAIATGMRQPTAPQWRAMATPSASYATRQASLQTEARLVGCW